MTLVNEALGWPMARAHCFTLKHRGWNHEPRHVLLTLIPRGKHITQALVSSQTELVARWVSSGVTAAASTSVKAHGSGSHQAPLRMAR